MKSEYHRHTEKPAPEVRKYLKAIGKKLRLSKKMKQSVLSDLMTEIYARMEAGEPVEQVICQMGSPLQVAEGINREMSDLIYVKSPWRWACLALAVACGLVLLGNGISFILENQVVGTIGGMDGPTQIFVTTSPVSQVHHLLMTGMLLIMGILGFVTLSHGHRKKD